MLPMPVATLSGSEDEAGQQGGASYPVDHDEVDGQKNVLELFAGVGVLTAAINRYKRMKCWSKDIKRCPLEDITQPDESELICCAIDTKLLDYIHMAPPCNQYSIARWPKLRTQDRRLVIGL